MAENAATFNPERDEVETRVKDVEEETEKE